MTKLDKGVKGIDDEFEGVGWWVVRSHAIAKIMQWLLCMVASSHNDEYA